MKKNYGVPGDDTIMTPENTAFVTDLSSGFTKKEAADLGFDLVSYRSFIENPDLDPAIYPHGEIEYDDNEDMNGFYVMLTDPGTTDAKTGSSMTGFLDVFKKRLNEGKTIIYLGITRSLSSGMYNCASLAKSTISTDEEYIEDEVDGRILILETASIAGGLGLFLRIFSDWYRKKPRTLGEIKQKIAYLRDHTAHIFTLFSYDYMLKSGRFTTMSEQLKVMLAKHLNIYPLMMSPRTGRLQSSWKRFHGRKKLINEFAKVYAGTAIDPTGGRVQLDHAGIDLETGKKLLGDGRISEDQFRDLTTAYVQALELKAAIEKLCPGVSIDVSHQTGSSIACHTGPQEISLFFLQKEIRPDLLEKDAADYYELPRKKIIDPE